MSNAISSHFRNVTASVTYLREDHEPDERGNFDDRGPFAGWDHRVWRVLLRTDGRRMTVTYRTGLGLGEPTAKDVLGSLVMDAWTVRSADGFEDWANELGYDPDSRSAERTYRQAKRQTERLRTLLGDRYDEFLALEF